MLLDLKKEEQSHRKGTTLLVGIVLPIVFIIQLAGVLATQQESPTAPELNFKQAIEVGDFGKESIIVKRMEDQRLPDVHLIGRKLYSDYNFPLQVIAVLLLSATIGCVTLSKRSSK